MNVDEIRSVPTDAFKIGQYPTLSERIRKGLRLHAFLSGGGLRVVFLRTKKDNEPKGGGYGEHPYIYNALAFAEEDAVVGGRPYGEVYGKIHPHYLTGDTTPAGGLDAWVRCGRAFDITFEDGQFVFRAKYLRDRKTPQHVLDALRLDEIKAAWKPPYGVVDFAGPQVEWEEDGYKFVAHPCGFCTGEVGHSIKCLNPKKGNIDHLMPTVEVVRKGPTLEELLGVLDTDFSDFDKWR